MRAWGLCTNSVRISCIGPTLAGQPRRQRKHGVVRQYGADMGKFLAIFNGAADEADKAEITAQQQSEFMTAWASWAQSHESAIVDPGAPLNAKKLVSAQGVEDFTDSATGYTIVEADSHDEAVKIFAEHPHLQFFSGNSIAVLECPLPPS